MVKNQEKISFHNFHNFDFKNDEFELHLIQIDEKEAPIKRVIAKTIAKCYNPPGLTLPCLTQAKQLLHGLWENNVDWDDELGPKIKKRWKEITTLKKMKMCRFPEEACNCFPGEAQDNYRNFTLYQLTEKNHLPKIAPQLTFTTETQTDELHFYPKVIAHFTHQTSMSVLINSPGFEMKMVTDAAKNHLKINKVSGCRNCEVDLEQTIGHVECKTFVIYFDVDCYKKSIPKTIHLAISQHKVDENCTLKSPGGYTSQLFVQYPSPSAPRITYNS
uniref:Uncharacterized protein n=1 Tax=Acrobeloides nanus TaxID=290746 RepID=A0A914CH33_9BILA